MDPEYSQLESRFYDWIVTIEQPSYGLNSYSLFTRSTFYKCLMTMQAKLSHCFFQNAMSNLVI